MNKILKSVISVILCICMVFPMTGYVSAANVGKVKNLEVDATGTTTVTLSWKKVSGAEGYRVYRYNSSDDEWERVKTTSSTSTKITGLSSAKTYKFKVRAYDGKRKGKYSSVVTAVTKPKKVGSLSSSSVTTNSLRLSWSSVKRATGYKVYAYDTANKKWKFIGKTTSTSTGITGLTSGAAYKYKVRAYYKSGNTTKNGSYSSVLTVVTKPERVKNLKVSNVGNTSYKLSWSKVDNADKYDIYRYESNGWKKLTTVTRTSYTVTNASSNSVSYRVRAVVENGSKNVNGSFSSTVKAKANGGSSSNNDENTTVSPLAPATPTGLSVVAVPGSGKIQIQWEAVENAKGYQVYKYNAGDGEWVRIRTTSSTNINYGVGETGNYIFKVRSYNTINNENVYSAFSEQAEVYYMADGEGDSDEVISDLEKSGILGYLYDPVYNCFYTAEDPWQRSLGFTPVYDYCAPFTIMFYSTKRLKFEYDGLDWMIQIWKGQYGWVLIGAEIGVYTRESELPLDFYGCASDENMLKMSMTLRLTHANGTYDDIIVRPYDKYWWCTGFVPGSIVPRLGIGSDGFKTDMLTMHARITLKSEDMRDAFLKALEENGFALGKSYIYSGCDVIFWWT